MPHEAELLRTLAHEGALALAQAVAYSELEKRRKQQAAAWRDEREALVETLSAEIAHEVRYPINFFRTIFQRASGRRVLDDEDIEIGCEEVDRLERLVSGLRRMATQHLERRVVEVSELTSRAEVLLRDRMGDHPLIVDIEDGGAIHCDIDKITQVLVNLLANALEATDGKGGVGVAWRLTARGGELSVWDTGPGFSGDPSRLFAPWYTTKPRGTGLGLAITHRLVRAHGWTIEATRRDSKTVFVVAVPASDVLSEVNEHAGAAGAEPLASTRAQGKRGMKILVVDDQRSARRVLRQMLGALDDVEILEASSVNEAVAVIEVSSPDLLVLDIRLSDDPRDRGGLEVLRTVARPVVARRR